jgi:hypothetical protein
MQNNTVYCKTHKGVEEISHRTYRLASRLRNMLIVIDGHTSWDELLQKLMVMDDADIALQTLLEEGYVQPIGDEPPTVTEM